MFRKILIANRGEIAVRIVRACRDLRISPVAVYSDADAAAVHVGASDEAVCIGPAPSVESYLNIPAIIAAAKTTKAEAIHPGYGFLAENANFARAVNEAGLTFIGPGAEAMEVMGSKTSARRAAVEAGVPIVPGTVEALTSLDQAKEIAEEFGYPVMLKASAGGGGKGMRLVASFEELRSGFANAKSEAASAFGDSSVYLEKAVARPRHIEIQVFADSHGNVVHLGERECSIQRRHQKVVEECPSPINDAGLRAAMGTAAVKLARAVNYVGAGTVEFLVADETRDFYFLEMNTRLQVEHPVTELVTGFDLVREQIRVASGAPLSFTQDAVAWRGHAIECRVYAEDPNNNFLPSPGRISFLQVPDGPGIRDDSGVELNSEVSIHYDPLISKLAAWGRTRSESIDRLRRALDEYEVGGIKTTLPFFREIVRDEEFQSGRLDTGFISRFYERRDNRVKITTEDNDKQEQVRRDMAVIGAAIHYAISRREGSGSPASTAVIQSRWKMSGRAALREGRGQGSDVRGQGSEVRGKRVRSQRRKPMKLKAQLTGKDYEVLLNLASGAAVVEVDGRHYDLEVRELANGQYLLLSGSQVYKCRVDRKRDPIRETFVVVLDGQDYDVSIIDPKRLRSTQSSGTHQTGLAEIVSPMPGKIVRVLVEVGASVEAGAGVVVVEAMKMQNELKAPKAGVVLSVKTEEGAAVSAGDVLAVIE